METKGRILEVVHRIDKVFIKMELPIDAAQDIERLMYSDLKVILKMWREGRSRNANNYFYVLCEKLADALRVSKPYIHNLMLRKYGQIQRLDGKPVWVVLPETEEVSKRVDEDETLHVRPTDEVKQGKDGKMYRTYLLLKGSHELNTRDMSILIDGIVSECKEVGVETATPEEIAKMKALWGRE